MATPLPGKMNEGFTLGTASVPMRLMCTLFVVAIGLGILSAHINLAHRVGAADGQPGIPTLEEIRIHFAGDPKSSRLEKAITPPGGVMSDHLDDAQREVIIGWIREGAPQGSYETAVLPIVESNCITCHEFADGTVQPILHVYEEIIRTTVPGTPPMSVGNLALLTHMHALGMATFYGLLAVLLWLTHARESVKFWGMVLPILGVIIDLSGWWLTALVSPAFAWCTMIGGLLQGFGVIPCILGPLWEMWLRRG